MTDPTDIGDGMDEDEVLAAEFALRLLEGEEAEAAQRRVLSDRAFADRVAMWNTRFADLSAEVGPVEPSADARRALMDRLFAEPRPARPTLWQRISGPIGAVGLLASLVMGVLLLNVTDRGPVYVSELVSEDGSFRYLAYIDTEARTMRLVRTDGTPPDSGSIELWGHAPDDPPVSFGVIPVADHVTVPVPEVLRSAPDGLIIALSNEPEGGSPTGQPTGEVLASGQATGL